MRSTGKRVLSALLTIAMIATLLVVPAVAAGTESINLNSGTIPSNTFFTVANGNGARSDSATITLADGTTLECPKCLKFQSSTTVDFSTDKAGTCYLYFSSRGVGGAGKVNGGSAISVAKGDDTGTYGVLSFNTTDETTAKQYQFKRSSGNLDCFYIEWVPAAAAIKYTITASATNGTVKFKVGETEVTEAAEGDEVTVVPAANAGYKVDSITTNPSLTVTDNKFTMPAQAVTVTVNFVADTRSDADITGDVAAAVKTALTGYSAVAQADVNTEAAAKAAVEAKLADLDKQNCTVTVTISGFSAATAGDETNEDGTNGSFQYAVAVEKGSSHNVTNVATVTIMATPKEYTQAEAKNATLAVRKETMKGYGGGTAATVFAGAKVVPAEVMKALDDALTEAQAVAEATKTSAEYGAAIKKLKEAEATFKAAVADISETGTKATAGNAAKGLYVMEADAMYAAAASDATSWDVKDGKYFGKGVAVKAGTDNYFSVKCVGTTGDGKGSRLESSPTAFVDGYAPDYRLNLNKNESGNNVITFNVTNVPATMKIYWGSNNKAIQLDGSTVVAAQPKNIFGISTVDIATAGAKTLSISGGGNYIYRVEVQETVTQQDPTTAPAFATPNGNVGQVQKDGKVSFTLATAPDANTTYKLYDAATDGTQMGSNAAVTASGTTITFALTNEQKPTGTSDLTWYVTAEDNGKDESERVAVTVKPYIPVTKVSLVHFTTTDPGTGETHEPDHAGTVDHKLYEKMPNATGDVIGNENDHDVKYPNGWKLKAVVEPSNATNQEVVFSNVRVTPEFISVAADGTVMAIKAGTGRVRVSSVGEPNVTAAFDMTVLVRVASVDIQKKDGTAAPARLAMGETLELKAVVTASASASQSHDVVNWTSSDETVATVSAAGVVTPVKAGTVTITATNNVDKDVKDTLELEITKGTPALKLTAGNEEITSGGTVRFKLEGVPQGVTPVFTVKQGTTEVNTVTVEALEGDENYNYKAVMPTNASGATVTYTITASVVANDSWNAAEKSVSVGVLDKDAKNIFIVKPGAEKTVELVKGQSAKLEVEAQVNAAGQVKDDAATGRLTYAWAKDGETLAGETGYDITVDTAGTYVCTITAAAQDKATPKTVTFTVTVVAPAMTTINVTAADGVDYTAATGALKITGPVDAVFTVTSGPEGHEDTVVATSDKPSVARVTLADGKLTITPWSVGSAVITLKGETATDVVKTINVTVVKAAAPAALTASDYTVTQPTAVGGKGTIKITQNAPEGTEYVYRLGDEGEWLHFPANKTIEVEPGTYKIRVYVPKPELQETTNGVAVEIKAVSAAPTVDRVAVSTTADSVKVGASVQLTAQVHMSNNTVSATEKVTWTTSDASVATVSETGLVTGVKEGVVTITATSVTDSTKKGSKTLSVTGEQGPAAVDKTALTAAVAEAKGVYAIGEDVEVMPAGTKAGTVDKGQQFVNQDVYDALGEAIAKAEAVLKNDAATQADVNKALDELTAAKAAFKVQVGSKGSKRPSSSRDERNPGGTTQPTGLPFTDVKAEDWFFGNVQKAYEKGLMKGVDAERFAPNSNTTRAMVATVLFRLDGEKKADVDNLFNDVAADSWFVDAVTWAAEKGIVKGYDETTFAPNDNVTREQLVVMLYRYAAVSEKSEKDLSAFADAAAVSEWATEAMTWAVEKGIILGRGNGQLDPQGLASRAEICAVLVRFLDLK